MSKKEELRIWYCKMYTGKVTSEGKKLYVQKQKFLPVRMTKPIVKKHFNALGETLDYTVVEVSKTSFK